MIVILNITNLFLKRVSSIIVVFLVFLSLPLYAEGVDWNSTAQRIEEVLNSSMESYKDGRVDEAKKAVTDAYFNFFEGEGMENAVSLYISDARKSELEGMFSDLRNSIAKNRPLPKIEKKKELLALALKYDAARLPTGGARKDSNPYWLFLNSLIIILREGFEAILIISALSAYLLKTGRGDKIKTIYTGTGLALVASLLTAVILNAFLTTSMAAREAMEGVTMLLATAVLFYVSYWLITKVEVKRWHHYIQSKVDHSLGKGSVLALGFTAFLAVYREGAETVLFYQALYSTSGGNLHALLAGFILGSLLLLGLFFIIKYASIRIPLGVFFTATSALLYYLAISFAGKGIRELQEAEWIPATTIEGLPSIDLLGFYPTWEGLLAQSILILALVTALFYALVLRTKDYPLERDMKKGEV